LLLRSLIFKEARSNGIYIWEHRPETASGRDQPYVGYHHELFKTLLVIEEHSFARLGVGLFCMKARLQHDINFLLYNTKYRVFRKTCNIMKRVPL